jgi:Ca2+-transporting ATPase
MQATALLPGSEASVVVRSALPGRFRLWVPGLYRNEGLKRTLETSLNGAASQRHISANVVAATVLVIAPEDAQAHTLVAEVERLLLRFADESGSGLADLARRGRSKPAHLLVNGSGPKRPTLGLARRPKKAADDVPGEEQTTHPWHMLDVSRVCELINVGVDGLSDDDARERLARFQSNSLAQVEKRSGLAMFLGQFKELPVALLAGSTVLSMATGGVADGLVILGVIVINGVIGYVTESRAERTIASLTRDDVTDVLVIRQGRDLCIAMEEVVPGDVLRLAPGTLISADARLTAARDLTVDESALTGESMPVGKTVDAIADAELPLADRTNMVYRGTLVTGGSGTALVIATGRATQVGQLQNMVSEVERPETPMQKQLRHLGERTMIMAGAVCGGVFLLGLVRGQPIGAMVRTAVSLAVAAVPEGLPTVAITTLAIGIRKMKEHDVLVRRLDAIETLGAVQVLCFDKTGTITMNQMRVVKAAVGNDLLAVDAGAIDHDGKAVERAQRPDLDWLLQVGALCSEAELVPNGDGLPKVKGSSTEAALVEFALQAGIDVARLREEHPLCKLEARAEGRKLMATIHQRLHGGGYIVAVKGSPLEVLELCDRRLVGSELSVLSDADRRAIRRQNERMASEALRVLGIAYSEHAEQPDAAGTGLIWVGLSGLADPPRKGLPELFEKFRRAGVRSVMITGDQSATAYAVAKQVGLAVDGELRTLDSVELENMDPDVLAELAPTIQVFSRVSPRHKLRIVQALQKSGLVVAMTGDGINDCPALKAADIGVAMGGAGGSVAREVADVILETDELAGMLTAIEHGRVIHADIKKAVRFILATNLSEILLTLLSVAAGFGEGMTPMQLLWINLVSDIFPELALALQPPEKDVLDQPPRDPEAKMFSKDEFSQLAVEGALLTAGAMSVYGYGISRYGVSPQAQSVSFLSLSTAQLLHAFSVRSEKNHLFDGVRSPPNPFIPLSVGGGIALTLIMQMIPAARRWFGSSPMPPVDWAIAALGAVGPLLANEMVKAVRFAPRRNTRHLQLGAGGD